MRASAMSERRSFPRYSEWARYDGTKLVIGMWQW